MHVIALVKSPEHVCCRYRLKAFRTLLKEAGHHLELRSYPKHWLSRWFLRDTLKGSEAVVLQRKLLPAWELALLRRAVKYLIFDFDDAVFLRDSSRARRFASMLPLLDAVVAGNSFLAEQAAVGIERQRVHLIPTCINPAGYPLARHDRHDGAVQLVWIGSASTLRGLEEGQTLLEEAGRRCPGLVLKIICDQFLTLRHLPVLSCPWSEANEARELASADIGISWLPDDLWSRGKCGLKVLQYMAAGLPVVANPVGVQTDLIRHGETGFLAETTEEWTRAIELLAGDPELRRRMGQAGRQRVETEFDLRAGTNRWLAVFEQLQPTTGKPACLPHRQKTGAHLRPGEAYAPG